MWRELLNTDAVEFGGSGHGNLGGVEAVPVAAQHRAVSLGATIPLLGAAPFRPPIPGDR
jgi:1,4-alpha-glucan branching enzyme